MTDYRRGLLTGQFTGVAVKKVKAVETKPASREPGKRVSNQHEFNSSRLLRSILGSDDRREYPAKYIWLSDGQEGISEEGTLTWYDSRRRKRPRSEYRLYYDSNGVTELMNLGDTVFIADTPEKTGAVIVVPSGSTIESQLLWLFGLDGGLLRDQFQVKEITYKDDSKSDFAIRYVLSELGIEPEESESEKLDKLVARFEGHFPPTTVFSKFARFSLDLDPRENPDELLIAWMEREEALFRRLERQVVQERIAAGFNADFGADVDGFLKFSLGVQNRRKSRVGHALEHHLAAIFDARQIRYGKNQGALTENQKKPDFLFPGSKDYHDGKHDGLLTMLGAKSSCKDRWRQVLSEANKIKNKHLITLEPGISENQTTEMKESHLQLIVPKALHATYKQNQRDWLMSLNRFVEDVQKRQIAFSQ